MKKLLIIILFYLPLIGLGQITVNEVQKKQNKFIENLSYSLQSGVGLEIIKFTQQAGEILEIKITEQTTFFSYYAIPNLDYKIPLKNWNVNLYNNISLPIILRNMKKNLNYPWDETINYYASRRLLAKIDYSVGIESKISKDFQYRLGVVIPVTYYYLDYKIPSKYLYHQDLRQHNFDKEWGGGLNLELDYSISDNLSSFLSISREFRDNPLRYFNSISSNSYMTEILIGVNYKL